MKILVLTDNSFLLTQFIEIIKTKHLGNKHFFDFYYSYNNPKPEELLKILNDIKKIDVKNDLQNILDKYDLLISLHCKQLFPKELVNKKLCINVHPGYNPNNRGWFPQVFSILNKKPLGATIHIMDELIDHGPIIAQKEIVIKTFDTSGTLYNKILSTEIELIEENIEQILVKDFTNFRPSVEGNYNSKKDFEKLCKINLGETLTFKQAIDRLRALTQNE